MKCLCGALQGSCDSGHVSSAMQSKQGEAASWEDMYSFGDPCHRRACLHGHLASAEALKAPSHKSTVQQPSRFRTLPASCSKPQAEALLFVPYYPDISVK